MEQTLNGIVLLTHYAKNAVLRDTINSIVRPISIFGEFGWPISWAAEYYRPRAFRAKLEQWLDTHSRVWPHCPARITRTARVSR